MVCLQSLGSSIDVLKTLGPLMEAGFTGREDKPQALVDAFQDYWDMASGKESVPKGGWPSTVITCLNACGREVTTKPTSLPAESDDIAAVGKTSVPVLGPAFNWGSSSTIAADEDNASDVTMTSQDSSTPLVAPVFKVTEAPSTPEAASAMSSPQRPSKTVTIRRTDMNIFSPLAQPTKLDYNFIMGTTSPSTSPSRLPRSPLRSPKKTLDGSCSSDKENTPPKPAALPSLLDRIALVSSPGTPKLGKRRASNVPTDPRPNKKSRGERVARKSIDGYGDDRGADTEDDSEAEREEVRKSLLSPVTPSSAGQRHQQHASATLPAFTVVAPRMLLRPCSRSPSPTPQPPQHKRKRGSVFMDAVEIPKPRPASSRARALRKTRSTSLHMDVAATPTKRTREPAISLPSDEEKIILPPLSLSASLSLSSSSGQVVRRSLRRAKSLVTFVSGAGVSDRPSVSATPAARPGKRQRVAAGVRIAAFLAMKTKEAGTAESDDDAATTTATDDDDDDAADAAVVDSSSPISAALKRARVLFGSGKSIYQLSFSLHCFLHCALPI
jgi:hypothetical protein